MTVVAVNAVKHWRVALSICVTALRIYNVTKQGTDHDKDGRFIKQWVPELRNVPLRYVHEPCE